MANNFEKNTTPQQTSVELDKAVRYHQSGEFRKAEDIYRRILEIHPAHPDALHLLGLIAHQTGKHDAGIRLITKSIQIFPDNPVCYSNLSAAFIALGKTDDAISCLQKAIELKPDYAQAHYKLGMAFKAQGKSADAAECFQNAVRFKQDYADAFYYLGILLREQGKLNEAMSCFQRLSELNPNHGDALIYMGLVLQESGRSDAAMDAYQKAAAINPNSAEAYNNIGNIFKDQGQSDKAIFYYQSALNANPDFAEAYGSMGTVLQEQGRFDEAISFYQQAIERKPNLAEAYSGIGSVLQEQGKFSQAVSYYQKAAAQKANSAYSSLVLMLKHICAWDELAVAEQHLDELTQTALKKEIRVPESPFVSLIRNDDPAINFAVAKSAANEIAAKISGNRQPATNITHHASRITHHASRITHPPSPITIAYLSNDFRNHPVAHLTLSLFRLHNRDQFKIVCYSYGEDDGSPYRKKIRQDCDQFVELRHLNHTEAAARIREDQADILVDLTGYTRGSRPAICALGPAPVQVTYLGFSGTSGADFFDYLITDKIVTPEDHACFYSEKLVYMPHCYMITDHAQPIAKTAWKKSDFGLPNDAFVFCSFNQAYKIDASIFDIWIKILHEVPKSVLWLMGGNEAAEDNLKKEAQAKGLSSNRLIFAEKLPTKAEHLARVALADLGLDPRIYNGHATTVDALWAGIPVVAIQGNHFPSRTSSSLLTAAGMPELITHNWAEYKALAVKLATHPEEFHAIREKLEKKRFTEPLFDTPRFVRNLEKAYQEMWRIFQAGEKPRRIEVQEAVSSPHITGKQQPAASNQQPATSITNHASRITHHASRITNHASRITHHASIFYRMGVNLKAQGRFDEAISCFQSAMRFKPDMPEAHVYIGNMVRAQGKLDEALSAYQKAIQIRPDYAIAYNNMGNILKDMGRTDEAISSYQNALRFKPDLGSACNNLLFQLQQTCDWKAFGEIAARMDEITRRALDKRLKTDEDPFVNLTRHADPRLNLEVAKSHSRALSKNALNLKNSYQINFSYKERKQRCGSKITVAYLSNDFHNHATAHLMFSLFGLHNRDEFNIFCYSYGPDDESDYRRRIQQDCEKFSDISKLNDADAAKRIYEDRADILVDLKGYTWGNRFGIAALRPAPVQICYLGFPGTTGTDFFDYIITDAVVTPEYHAIYYTEKFIYMPHCYQVNDYQQRISETLWKRSDFGLPEKGFVFCSFTRAYKIEPVMFDVWMKILRQIPESVLWLLPGNNRAEDHLKLEAETRGVNPERLVFAAVMPKAEHLARHRLADLVLDTRIYNGHTTTSDALWAGLPVITLQGSHFASRVSSSILRAVGLSELITHDLAAYETLAVHLANHPNELQRIREKLAKNRLTEPLFDTPGFARDLEAAYKAVWKRFLAGETPGQINVAEKPTTQPLNHSNTQTLNHSTTQPLNHSTTQPLNHSNTQTPKHSTTQPLFKTALGHHQSGDIQKAQELYQEILRIHPDHSDALHFLGLIAYQQGQNEAAEERIRDAIRINPGNPNYHYNLGCVFQAQGKLRDAIPCFQQAVNLKPDFIEAHNNMGSVFQTQGNLDQAISCFQRVLEIRPDVPEAYNNLGNALQSQGKSKAAVLCFQKAIDLRPDYAEACNNLGSAFSMLYNFKGAAACFQRAIQLKPDYTEAHDNLGNAFQNQGLLEQAISSFQKAIERNPNYVKSYYNMGNVFMYLDRPDDALRCFHNALDIVPTFSPAIAGKARVLIAKGDFNAARQYLEPIIASRNNDPDIAMGYARLLAHSRNYREAAALLEDILSREPEGSGRISQLCFNLGEFYDKIGDYDLAFRHYDRANSMKPLRFNAKQHEEYISRIISLYGAEKKSSMPKAGNDSELPVFIVGMPRSGTTLAEQILDSHPHVFGAGELPDIGKIAFELRLAPEAKTERPENLNAITRSTLDKFARSYLEKLRGRSAHSLRVTDKMPNNFFYLGLISQLFPRARIIHCIRDPRDVGLSVYFQNFLGSHDYAFDLKSIGAYYRQYKRIMRHWKEQFQIPLLEIRYEELVADQERVSREMVAYLGLEWDAACLNFHKSKRSVATSSSEQVREPVYTRSAGRWKNYEKYLKPLIEAIKG
jgi:protein O-GlcNAc transferase